MMIGLFTVRIVLKTLGSVDYGINNVVAGTVSMFSFLTGAMAVGCQRFFSFYMGKKDFKRLKEIFTATFVIYLLLASIILILSETVGLWLLVEELNIPKERMFAAHYIFQFSIFNFMASIMVTPFIALVISHEDMSYYAKLGIVESLLKLLIVYLLVVLPYDKLIVYGFLYMSVSYINLFLFFIYAYRKYAECSLKLEWNRSAVCEIFHFNVWNLFGNLAWIIKNQGLSILLNIFIGPVVNAAHQIANQIRNISSIFAQNFSTAVNPQITKLYASNDYIEMFRLSYRSIKLIFILMLVIVLPAILNLDFVLNLWFTEVPPYTSVICKLLLVETLVETMSSPLATMNQATGKIKYYQMWIGIIGMFNLPIAYLMLRMEYEVFYIFMASIILQCFIVGIRIVFLNRIPLYSIKRLFITVFFPCVATFLLSYGISVFLFEESHYLYDLIFAIISQVTIILLLGFFVTLDQSERTFAINLMKKGISKLTSR